VHTSLSRFLAPFAAVALAACQPAGGEAPFHLDPAFDSLELPPGGQISSFVRLERSPGFAGAVRMSFEDLPPGFHQEWTRDSANGDHSLRLEADDTVEPGTFLLTLVGSSDAADGAGSSGGPSSDAVPVSIVVPAASTPSSPFTVSVSPSVIEVAQGRSATVRVNTRRGHASQADITLGTEGAPAGIGVSFAQNPVTMGQGTNATIFVAAGVAPGSYPFKVTGRSGNFTAKSDLLVTVRPAADFTFELVLNPPAKILVAGTSQLATIVSAQRIASFDLPIVVSAQNLPAGVTSTFGGTSAETCTLGTGICFLTLTIDEAVVPGDYSITIRGEADGQVKTAPFEFELLSGDDFPDPNNVGSGALESDFGGNGTGFATVADFAPTGPAVVLANGKILVSGARNFASVVALLDSDGVPDPSFGEDGFAASPGFPINAAALLADGRITVAGDVDFSNTLGVARYLATGAFDTSFSGDGIFQNQAVPAAFAVFPAAGNRTLVVAAGEVVRLTEGGNLDPDFDGDGRKPVAMGFTSGASALLDANGRIVAAGASQSAIAVARFTVDGVLDTHFSGDGKVSVSGIVVGGRAALAIDPHGRILLAGTALNGTLCCAGFAAARLNGTGQLDASFDGDGVKVVPIVGTDIARGVAVREDGAIMLVGTTTNNVNTADYAATRLADDGSVDTSFGAGGLFHFGFLRALPGGFLVTLEETFTAVVSLGHGRMLAIGTSRRNPAALTLARFAP
jgi:uncharacterized delta-60 repeat protein